jgi:hypothetical protein
MPDRRHLLGAGLVAVGTFILGQRIGRSDELGVLLRTWWPLGLVAFGLVSLVRLVERPFAWAFVGPLAIIAGGTVVLLHSHDRINPAIYPLLWPTGLVLAGLWIALAGVAWQRSSPSVDVEFTRFVWLGGEHIVRRPGPFKHAALVVLFGAVKLDLRAAVLAGVSIDVTALFGTVEILLPDHADVDERRVFVLGRGKLEHTTLEPLGAQVTINVLGLVGDVTVTRTSLWVPSRESSTPTPRSD